MVPQIKFFKSSERSAWYGTLGVSVETRQKPRSSCSLKQQMLISPASRVSHEKRKKNPKYYNFFELFYQNSKLQNIPPHLLLLIVVIINPNYCLWAFFTGLCCWVHRHFHCQHRNPLDDAQASAALVKMTGESIDLFDENKYNISAVHQWTAWFLWSSGGRGNKSCVFFFSSTPFSSLCNLNDSYANIWDFVSSAHP